MSVELNIERKFDREFTQPHLTKRGEGTFRLSCDKIEDTTDMERYLNRPGFALEIKVHVIGREHSVRFITHRDGDEIELHDDVHATFSDVEHYFESEDEAERWLKHNAGIDNVSWAAPARAYLMRKLAVLLEVTSLDAF